MGRYFIDQYSYLHFAVGIILYYWNINISNVIILHILFEFIENTIWGINIINKFYYWPGGKSEPDKIINIIGDIISTIIGWISANYINYLVNNYKLHNNHYFKI